SSVPWLMGATVRDDLALMQFLLSMNGSTGNGSTDASGDASAQPQVSSSLHNGVMVLTIAGTDSTYYLAAPNGNVLISTVQGMVFDALDRSATQSLASSASFQKALAPGPTAPLAVFYSDSPSVLGAGSAIVSNVSFTAATIRLVASGLQIDTTSGLDPTKSSAAQTAMLSRQPNALQAARVAPPNSSVFMDI